jgi:hypothetical protein
MQAIMAEDDPVGRAAYRDGVKPPLVFEDYVLTVFALGHEEFRQSDILSHDEGL